MKLKLGLFSPFFITLQLALLGLFCVLPVQWIKTVQIMQYKAIKQAKNRVLYGLYLWP